MSDDASWIFAALAALYLFMRLVVNHHYKLTPALDKTKISEIVDFIARCKNISLDPKIPLPSVYMCELNAIALSDESWKLYNGVADFAVEGYFAKWRRVWLVEGCRQNILAHALVHYIQFEYEPDALDENGKEKEAWAITRKYLKHAHPMNYWMLTIPFGVYCWWTSTPY